MIATEVVVAFLMLEQDAIASRVCMKEADGGRQNRRTAYGVRHARAAQSVRAVIARHGQVCEKPRSTVHIGTSAVSRSAGLGASCFSCMVEESGSSFDFLKRSVRVKRANGRRKQCFDTVCLVAYLVIGLIGELYTSFVHVYCC